ncbi:uncharacterized protein J7T54_005697 [Emericellopsis cladophorae]|uniref:Uncharacterized protein n=1 Tax=Emericellopsis cladophorae TaxID=2686198 RepID=A0A9P9Y5X3_9HYPO|nr:uncharacterized protein J7T54_005697 [Emericellopsis cladophorae]KAI6783668.1 hypothetical protein J7T54_005697 [Emericellopsis cladophorae]
MLNKPITHKARKRSQPVHKHPRSSKTSHSKEAHSRIKRRNKRHKPARQPILVGIPLHRPQAQQPRSSKAHSHHRNRKSSSRRAQPNLRNLRNLSRARKLFRSRCNSIRK